jgi:ABC-type lipoprotein release transport system permease subunit
MLCENGREKPQISPLRYASVEMTMLFEDEIRCLQEPLDPAVFTAVAGTLLAVAAGSCIVPAWRASRLDPMHALRTE